MAPWARGYTGPIFTVQSIAMPAAVFSMTPDDHGGARAHSQAMVEIHDGAYRTLPQ